MRRTFGKRLQVCGETAPLGKMLLQVSRESILLLDCDWMAQTIRLGDGSSTRSARPTVNAREISNRLGKANSQPSIVLATPKPQLGRRTRYEIWDISANFASKNLRQFIVVVCVNKAMRCRDESCVWAYRVRRLL